MKRLTRDIANGPVEARRIMNVVMPVIRELSEERGLQPDEEQLRLVAQSLARAAWPDSSATGFEIPIARPDLP